ncbi:MAG: hypothetical protein PHT78_03305 [Desulfitobacteriaceae bacterium]|nr:hypothetical protein [Desulfitobacteriaceae bacterium]MDD4752269.1 hypothetical protein [Desulfitobacteriaceae bacterium]
MEFRQLIMLLWLKKRFIIGIPLLAICFFVFVVPLIRSQYKTQASLMVQNLGYASYMIPEDRINADKRTMETCIHLLGTAVYQNARAKLPEEWQSRDLYEIIKIDNPDASMLIILSALDSNPQRAAAIINHMINQLPVVISQVLPTVKITVLDHAQVPTLPYRGNIVFSGALVLFLSFFGVVSWLMFMANRCWEV